VGFLPVLVEDVRGMRGRRRGIFINRILNHRSSLYRIEMVKEGFWDMVILMDMVLIGLTVSRRMMTTRWSTI
jgi:hypothetical protein